MLPINDMTLYCLYSVFHSNSVVVYLSCCHYYITCRVCRTRGNLPKGITCIIHGYLHNLYLHCMASLQRLTVRNQGHIMYDGWSYWRRESNMLLSMRITISSATRSSEVYTLPFDDFTSRSDSRLHA